MRIVLMTTSPDALMFLLPHVRALAARGVEVHTIAAPSGEKLRPVVDCGALHHEIPMRRTIHPLADIVSLYRLWRLLCQLRPEVLQTHTPKAGLLGMLAGKLARVPFRMYTVNGIPAAIHGGVGRLAVGAAEWVCCSLATKVFCVSRSARRYLVRHHLCPSHKCCVIGSGGSHGVDLSRFDPDRYGPETRKQIRKQYGIPTSAVVMGYVGRMVPAKGVRELFYAWKGIRETHPGAFLLLCGYLEREHPISQALVDEIAADCRVRFTNRKVMDVSLIYSAMDVNVLPSYCEGLPNVVLESAAMGIPTVATRVPGCIDAIRGGVTGVLVTPRSASALADGISMVLSNPAVTREMGRAARSFVARRFAEQRLAALWQQQYEAAFGAVVDRADGRRFPAASSI